MTKILKTQDIQSHPFCSDDVKWMRAAIAASRRALGRTCVNPPVGCVLVSADGRLLSVGHTGRGGVPHAEVAALQSLGKKDSISLKGGTAYVTLEPCCHFGKTPPCSDALIAAGIARLVIAIKDPDNRVNGVGLDKLRDAGIEIVSGVLRSEYEEIIIGFINKIQYNKPFCSVKVAASLDGRIAFPDKKNRWLTGPQMRRYVHILRSQSDAIITGVGTVIADDPRLDCRVEGLQDDSPPIYIFDRCLRVPKKAKIFKSRHPVTIFCSDAAPINRRKLFCDEGVSVVVLPVDDFGNPDVGAAMTYLGSKGTNHALVEAGSGLLTAFFLADAVDRVYWTQSNHLLGSDALAAIGKFGRESINEVAIFLENKYYQSDHRVVGNDRLTVLNKANIICGEV